MNFIKNFLREEDGVTAIEYGLIAALIAVVILKQNILGGSCGRVCPTEILCDDACVRNHSRLCTIYEQQQEPKAHVSKHYRRE